METKFLIMIFSVLIVGIMMNPLTNDNASTDQIRNPVDQNELESLLERESALLNMKKKLNGYELGDELNSLLDVDADESSDEEEYSNDFDGRLLSKKSAPRRIFIGNFLFLK